MVDTFKQRQQIYHYSPILNKHVKCFKKGRICSKKHHLTRNEYTDTYTQNVNAKFNEKIFHSVPGKKDPYKKDTTSYGVKDANNYHDMYLDNKISQDEWVAIQNGRKAPYSYKDVNSLLLFLSTQNRIVIPSGTLIRTTDPRYENHQYLCETEIVINKILNICGGYETLEKVFVPLSVTWVNSRKYFCNVIVDQKVLESN